MRIRADNMVRNELRQEILALKGLGVTRVDVAYSGSGDEGFINEVILTPPVPGFNTSRLHNLLYDYLDPAHVGDWVNNEGGFGEISINLETGRVTGDVNFNEMTSTQTKLTDRL